MRQAKTTIIVDSMHDESISHMMRDCMVTLGSGIMYHVRLDTVIIIRGMLPSGVADYL